MFKTVKTVDYYTFEKAVMDKVGDNKFSSEIDRYFFEGYANDSYNSLSIETLRQEIEDVLDGYSFVKDENEKEDYIETCSAMIEIFEDAGIGETETVLVLISW